MQFIRTTGDMRTYYEVIPDVVGFLRLQGGNIAGWGSNGVRMLDHFQMGPSGARLRPVGHRSARHDARHLW